MAIKPTITTLGELYQLEDEHDDDGILERLKQLAMDNLPAGWMDWQVRTTDIDEFVDPHNLDQVKFALPTVGIARAFNPDASDLMEKPYGNMKMKMLKWQFCRGLLYSPLRLCIRIRKSYEEQLSVLRAIHEMQPLLLTASEASQQLSDSKAQKSTRFEDLAVSTRMDSLENKLDRTLEVLGSILKNTIIKEQYEDDVGYSSLSDKGPEEEQESSDEELDNQSQCPTEEQEASPELREQRLVSPGWGKIGYSEDQNFNLYSELLSKTDLSFGTLCHAVLKQRQYLQDSILELSSKHAEAANDFISIIEGEQSKFRNISDDILRFICGKRAEMVDLCGEYHQMTKETLQKKTQPPITLEEEDYETLRKENPFSSHGMNRRLSKGFQIKAGAPRSPQKQLQSRNHKNSDTTKPKESHQGKRFGSNRKLICQED